MVKFKKKCYRCKKNYVTATRRDNWVMCYDCQKAELNGVIDDPEMKKFFDIPHEFYVNNSFLRDIKVKYLKFGNLTEKQIEAFKKTVDKLKEENSKD